MRLITIGLQQHLRLCFLRIGNTTTTTIIISPTTTTTTTTTTFAASTITATGPCYCVAIKGL